MAPTSPLPGAIEERYGPWHQPLLFCGPLVALCVFFVHGLALYGKVWNGLEFDMAVASGMVMAWWHVLWHAYVMAVWQYGSMLWPVSALWFNRGTGSKPEI